MKPRIPYFIAASTIALLLLIFMQVKWMQQSIKLIEEQFDQKVSMALCMAVDDLAKTDGRMDLQKSCSVPGMVGQQCCSDNLSLFLKEDNVKEVVDEALSFYNINLPFEMEISENDNFRYSYGKTDPSYSCSLTPLIDTKSHKLDISFPGKRAFVIQKMGLMLVSSIIILLFITGIFIYANYSLFKQKRISERNKEFFNHMAHEFKTPLTNIGLASRLLEKESSSPLLSIISSENKQLSEQVDRVLSMASIESGQYEIKKEKLQLIPLLESVKDQLKIQLDEKKAILNIEDKSEGIAVLGDKFHLSNAIRNIIDNALKYSTSIPIINISVMKVDENIKIQIQDNGIGISDSDQKMLFEKFFRIKEDAQYTVKGFGLGLSYVKKIMELHKGEISVKSKINQGSCFDLILPKMV